MGYGPDVLCRLYCMSKPIVAVAVLMLYERGKLCLEDPVAKYIPSFADIRVVSNPKEVSKTSATKPTPITIMHCLTHTSGLCYSGAFLQKPWDPESESVYPLTKRVENGEIRDLAHFVDELAKVPLRFKPGDKYSYSFSLDVLGR